MNVRFWIFENDAPIKLTLKPGQTLKWHRAWHNGEGWSARWMEWMYMEDDSNAILSRVVRAEYNDATDCDGRFKSETVTECPPWQLDSWLPREPENLDGQPIMYPTWQEVEYSQRDYAAEAMGY